MLVCASLWHDSPVYVYVCVKYEDWFLLVFGHCSLIINSASDVKTKKRCRSPGVAASARSVAYISMRGSVVVTHHTPHGRRATSKICSKVLRLRKVTQSMNVGCVNIFKQ